MPRYQFFLNHASDAREAGAVLSDSFAEALDAIAEEGNVKEGDTLEIGVAGFPPAHFELVALGRGERAWRPSGQLAA